MMNPKRRAHRIAARLEDKNVRCTTRQIVGRDDGQAPLRAHEYLIGYFTRNGLGAEPPGITAMRPTAEPDTVRMLFFVVYARKRKRNQVEEWMAVMKSGHCTLTDSIKEGTAAILHSPRNLDHILEWASGVLGFEGFDGYNHLVRIEGDTKLQYL